MTYDDLIAELRRWSDRITFAEIVREEAKRTVLVPGPASAVKLEAWLIAHGLDDVITVKTSQFLPVDTWFVVDEQAINAGVDEAVQEMTRKPLFEVKTNGCCGQIVGYGHLPGCLIGNYAWVAANIRTPGSLIKVIGT